jgi:hypothetical protein
MPSLLRKHRDRYLDRLAAEPLFRDVPRHLMPVVGRCVDPLDLAPGAVMRCAPAREVILVVEGIVLVTDAAEQAVAVIGPGGAIGEARARSECRSLRMVAGSPVRAFVVGRRELHALATVVPAVGALASAIIERTVERPEAAHARS